MKIWSISFVFALLLQSCWTKEYDYVYDTWIENSTIDTLVVYVGKDKRNTIEEPYYKTIIPPNSILNGTESGIYGYKTNEDTNPIKLRFSNDWQSLDTVLVYRNDSLKSIWVAPASSKPDSVHDFFNFNSWKIWQIDKLNGVMMFTIHASDFK